MPDLPDTLYARTLRALQDVTLCPACTTTLRAGRCAACGLDVSGPEGALVWRDSQEVVRALAARQDRVAALRSTQVPARQAVAATPARPTAPEAPRAPRPPAAAAPARPHASAHRGPAGPGPRGTAPAAVGVPPTVAGASVARPARRPWRVQTVLQVVGASLLVAASITFLVFAWDVMGLRGRAAVVAVGTLVVFALASWLRSRRLAQGAEAVGAIAVVLLLLDAWALRATDVLVVGDGPGQAGASALVCAALLTAWGARSRLRVGAVAGAALVPLAPLAWLPTVPDAAGAAALLLVAAAATTLRAVPPWAAGSAERAVLRTAAAVTLPAAVLAALAGAVAHLTGDPWRHVALLGAAVVVLVAQVLVEARTPARGRRAAPASPEPAPSGPIPSGPISPEPTSPEPASPEPTCSDPTAGAPLPSVPQATERHARVLRTAWAAGAGAVAAVTVSLALAAAARAAAGPLASGPVMAQVAVVGVCLVAAVLVLPRALSRPRTGDAQHVGRAWDADVRVAARAALVAAAAAAGWSALVVVATTAARLVPGEPTAAVPVAGADPTAVAAVGALVAAGALGVLAARRTHGGTARAAAAAWRAVVVLVALAVPVLAAVPPVGSLVVVAGEAGVVTAFLAAERRGPLGHRTARTGAVGAAVLAVLGVLPDPGWSAVALLVPAALAVVARTWSPARESAATSTLTATTLLLAACATAGPALGLPAATTLALAVAPVVGALLLRTRLVRATAGGTAERDAALGGAALATGVGWVASTTAVVGLPAGTAAGLVTAAPPVAAATALVVVAALLRAARTWGPGHVAVGAGAAAPVTALAVATTHTALGVPDGAGAALLVTVAGVVALVCAPLLRAQGGAPARHAAEVSGAIVVSAGIGAAAGTGTGTAAVALLLAAVGAGAWALAPGRGRAWWVALGLATSAWWVLLGAGDVVVVEPYTAPPGLVVAAVGAWHVARRRPHGEHLLVAGLALVTLPTALLPAVLDVGTRWVDRGIVAAGLAAAVVGAAVLVRGRRPAAADLLAGLGALLLVVGPLRRATTSALVASAAPTGPLLPDGTAAVELWAWPVAAALAVCAYVVRSSPARRVLDVAVPWALLVAAAGPTLLAALASPSSASAVVRVTAVGTAAVALALVGGARGRRLPAPGSTGRDDPARGAGAAGLGLLLVAGATVAATGVVAAHAPTTALGGALDLPVLVGGLVTLATVALGARRGDVPAAWAAAGTLAIVPSLLVRDAAARPVLWGVTAAVLLALAMLARPRGTVVPTTTADGGTAPARPGHLVARDVPRLLTGVALGVVVAGPWAAAVAHAVAPGSASPLRVELVAVLSWLVSLRHARTWRPGPVRPALRTTLVALLALPVVLATDASAPGTVRGVLVLLGGAALAWWATDRVGTALGLGTATLATAALALRGGPEPGDVPWTVLGLVAVAIGARWMLRDPAATSWRALGAPLVLTLGVPLAALVVEPAGPRVVVLLALGVAAVVAGAARRWQAPFLLGAAAVLATLVVVLSPLAADVFAAIDGWVLLAVGGALVLGLGVTYERRVQDAREAVRFVGEMR